MKSTEPKSAAQQARDRTLAGMQASWEAHCRKVAIWQQANGIAPKVTK